MVRNLRAIAVLFMVALPAFAAVPKKLQFEISFTNNLSTSAVDGHIIVILSKDNQQEPRFQVQEGIASQQAFGVDVDGWQPAAAAQIDESTLGYPLESLRDLSPGDYFVQAVLNVYDTFHLGNGKVVKLPPDK